METGAGKLHFTWGQLLANHLDFMLHWGYCLAAILLSGRVAATHQPAVLVYGIGIENIFASGSDKRFVAYCRHGPIKPLAQGNRLLIECALPNAVSTSPGVAYCSRPLISLLRSSRLGFFATLALAQKQLFLFFCYLFAVVRLPALSLLGKDFAYSAIALGLDRHSLIDAIILTTSNYSSQPLWVRGLRRSKTHMVWYAQNFKPVSYVGDSVDSEIPSAQWIRVDTHWVWTYAFADYLKTLGHCGPIEVVGPILWYLPEYKPPSKKGVELVVFDSPPFSDAVALRVGGYISNYNNAQNLRAFISDVTALKASLAVALQMPVSLRLKIKRSYKANYDKEYFDYLDQLNAAGVISLIDHSSNIYSLISSSHLVVVYPFSSPAYVAEALKVPSIYYDPTGSIVEQYVGDAPSLVHFSNHPDDLLKTAIAALRRVLANQPIDDPKIMGRNENTSDAEHCGLSSCRE
jgi:hypothetical protein